MSRDSRNLAVHKRAADIFRGRRIDDITVVACRARCATWCSHGTMIKRFVFAREDRPGEAWLSRFVAGRDAAERWYLGENLQDAPTAAECRDALSRHCSELVPHYDRVCGLVGEDDLAHRLTLGPTAARASCSPPAVRRSMA